MFAVPPLPALLDEPGSGCYSRHCLEVFILKVPPTVLVVDDSGFMRLALMHILKTNGFQVVGEAADGVEAVEFCKATRPDLVTMDILMPNKDGLEALREIKLHDPTIRVVMVSAMGQRKNVVDALGYGADNFIVKPFDEMKILRVLKALDLEPPRAAPG